MITLYGNVHKIASDFCCSLRLGRVILITCVTYLNSKRLQINLSIPLWWNILVQDWLRHMVMYRNDCIIFFCALRLLCNFVNYSRCILEFKRGLGAFQIWRALCMICCSLQAYRDMILCVRLTMFDSPSILNSNF